MELKKKIFFPVFLLIVLDFAFTLLGQSMDYWKDFSKVNEANPIAHIALAIHPIFFFFELIAYLVLLYFLFLKLPKLLKIWLWFALYLGHYFGSNSWLDILYVKVQLPYTFMYMWWVHVSYFFVISMITAFCIKGLLDIKKTA